MYNIQQQIQYDGNNYSFTYIYSSNYSLGAHIAYWTIANVKLGLAEYIARVNHTLQLHMTVHY